MDIGAFQVQPGPSTHFQLLAPAVVTSGVPFSVTVTALDAYGHTAVGYLGTVTFGSSDKDPEVALPPDYVFTANDQGLHSFLGDFTLATVGDQKLTISDTDNRIMASAIVSVEPTPAAPVGSAGRGPSSRGPSACSVEQFFVLFSRREKPFFSPPSMY
jgi:hypothetical protein